VPLVPLREPSEIFYLSNIAPLKIDIECDEFYAIDPTDPDNVWMLPHLYHHVLAQAIQEINSKAKACSCAAARRIRIPSLTQSLVVCFLDKLLDKVQFAYI
jgi:hypothetical protein